MSKVVLDTSAVLAALNGEPGGEIVADGADDYLLSSVNLAETIGFLLRRGRSQEGALRAVDYVDATVVPHDKALAEDTGVLIARTRGRGLSLGDCACLALALKTNHPVLTADRAWLDLDLGVEVRLIR